MKKINLPYDSNFYKEIMKYRKSNGKKIHYYNSYNNYNNIKCIWNHLSCILWPLWGPFVKHSLHIDFPQSKQ